MIHNSINKSGCFTFATKSIDKTAAKLGYGLKKSTTIKVWSIKNIFFIAILMIELMQLIQPAMTMTIQQHHQQKKNSLEFLTGNLDLNSKHHLVKYRKKHSTPDASSTNLLHLSSDIDPWVSPCGGVPDDGSYRNAISSSSRIAAWRNLRSKLKHENLLQAHFYNPKNDSLKELKLHHGAYKFLKIVNPKIHRVALRSWHKHAQIYVGSFAYLYKIEKKLDKTKSSTEKNEPTTELEHLFLSAHRVLCLIEGAINDTRFVPNIKIYSRAEMNRTLKFKSVNEISEIDLKFLKARYFKSLTGMMGSLQQKIKEIRYCGINDVSSSSNSATIESDEISHSSLQQNDIKASSSYSASRFVEDRRNAVKCEEIRKNRPRFPLNKRKRQQNEAQRRTISWI